MLKGALAILDEVWIRAQEGGQGDSMKTAGNKTICDVDMGPTEGYLVGRSGQVAGNPRLHRVHLVLKGQNVITAYPVAP